MTEQNEQTEPQNDIKNILESGETNPIDPGEGGMGIAYKLSYSLFKDRLGKESKQDLKILENMSNDDIIVIDGTYDHIHLVLKHSGLPFLRIDPNALHKLTLRPDQTIFVNCAANFPPEMTRKLTTFVNNGGQLVTTDWCLSSVLEPAFPGYVRYNQKPTRDEVVRIQVLDDKDPILKGFLDEERAPQWWLEGSSYPIEIINKEKVDVLVTSKALEENYGESAVIIRFKHGKGIVYHMISHFYLQRTETKDLKDSAAASSYAAMKGSSGATQELFENAEEENEDLNYASIQSASTSTEFIARSFIKHKKKFSK